MKQILSRSKLKIIFAIVVIAILSFSLGAAIVKATGSTPNFTISSGVYPGAPTYTVYTDGTGNYYAKNAYGQIDYTSTNAGTVISDAMATNKDVLLEGTCPLHMQSYKSIVLATNQNLTALNVSGFPGEIKSLYITGIGNFSISIYIDGVCTVTTAYPNTGAYNRGLYFFNSVMYYRPFAVRDFGTDALGECFYRIIDIPFKNSCEVVYTNYGSTINYWTDTAYVNFAEFQPSPTTTLIPAGVLHGFWNLTLEDTPSQPYPLFDTSGSGRFVGLCAFWDNPNHEVNDFTYLEGPMTIYVDNSLIATYNSSGHEEFFLNTFYFEGGNIASDRAGVTEFNNATASQIGAYRYFDTDEAMYYNTHFTLVENHWYNPAVYVNYFILYYSYS